MASPAHIALAQDEDEQVANWVPRRRQFPGLRVALAVVAVTIAALVAFMALTERRVPLSLGEYPEMKVEVVKAAEPDSGTPQKRRRKKLRIEGDLGALLNEKSLGKGAAQAPPSTTECAQHAKVVFDSVMMHAGLDRELAADEKKAFSDRFTGVMDSACQTDPLFIKKDTDWLQGAKDALEEQKPVMTKALAHNLNRAGLAWETKMQDWMLHESKATFKKRMGRSSTLPDDANVTEPHDTGRQGSWVPQSFNSADRWPHCRREIMRIHDQGICGSCWAFSCSQVLDARICIQNNRFDGPDATVAPGYFASCAANRAHPGDCCSGGWEYFCYQYVDRPGTPGAVSEQCSPYFGVGTGINHFIKRSHAPPCPSRCRPGYPRTLGQDGFKLPGVSRYQMLTSLNAHKHRIAKWAIYTGGPVNHGIYASGHFMGYSRGVYNQCTRYSANHAVVAYGWFVGGYFSKNSWGERWGDRGMMKIADCIVTDFTIPGYFAGWNSHIPYPLAPVR